MTKGGVLGINRAIPAAVSLVQQDAGQKLYCEVEIGGLTNRIAGPRAEFTGPPH